MRKIDVIIGKFEERVTETNKIRFTANLKYAISLSYLEISEVCGKKYAVERMILKDVIEDIDENPMVGDTLEMMKRDLWKMKVAENCEEPFKKETRPTI